MSLDNHFEHMLFKVSCTKIIEGINNLRLLGYSDDEIMEAVRRQIYDIKLDTQEDGRT